MLGFDAVGKLALGQLPGRQSFTLAGVVGAFTETGVAALFRANQVSSVGSFAETGIASLFKVSELASSGSYSVTGEGVSLISNFRRPLYRRGASYWRGGQ